MMKSSSKKLTSILAVGVIATCGMTAGVGAVLHNNVVSPDHAIAESAPVDSAQDDVQNDVVTQKDPINWSMGSGAISVVEEMTLTEVSIEGSLQDSGAWNTHINVKVDESKRDFSQYKSIDMEVRTNNSDSWGRLTLNLRSSVTGASNKPYSMNAGWVGGDNPYSTTKYVDGAIVASGTAYSDSRGVRFNNSVANSKYGEIATYRFSIEDASHVNGTAFADSDSTMAEGKSLNDYLASITDFYIRVLSVDDGWSSYDMGVISLKGVKADGTVTEIWSAADTNNDTAVIISNTSNGDKLTININKNKEVNVIGHTLGGEAEHKQQWLTSRGSSFGVNNKKQQIDVTGYDALSYYVDATANEHSDGYLWWSSVIHEYDETAHRAWAYHLVYDDGTYSTSDGWSIPNGFKGTVYALFKDFHPENDASDKLTTHLSSFGNEIGLIVTHTAGATLQVKDVKFISNGETLVKEAEAAYQLAQRKSGIESEINEYMATEISAMYYEENKTTVATLKTKAIASAKDAETLEALNTTVNELHTAVSQQIAADEKQKLDELVDAFRTSFTMQAGAAIRMVDPYALVYRTKFDAEAYAVLKGFLDSRSIAVTFGVKYVKGDTLEGVTAQDLAVATVGATSFDATIVIGENSVTDKFTAAGYIKFTFGSQEIVVTASANDSTKSVKDIAIAALADTTANKYSADQKTKLQAIVDVE